MKYIDQLPEKWFIPRNSENYIELNAWNNKNYTSPNQEAFSNSGYAMFSDKEYGPYSNALENGYIQLTFDEFKRLVLGQKIQPKEILYELY